MSANKKGFSNGSKMELISFRNLKSEDIFTYQYLKNGKIKNAGKWFNFGKLIDDNTLSVIELKSFEFSTLDSNQIFNIVRLKRNKPKETELFEEDFAPNFTLAPRTLKRLLSKVQFPESFTMFRFKRGKNLKNINEKPAEEMHECTKIRLENGIIKVNNKEYTENRTPNNPDFYECNGQFYIKEKDDKKTNVCALSFVN